ncbi:MAG: ATP-binding protein, partial [Candidatus Eremiobacterota bacterium]
GSEVDFVVYGPLGFWALEVKHSGTVHPADLRGLKGFLSDYPEARGALLYRGAERLRVDGLDVLNVEVFLRELRPGSPLPL